MIASTIRLATELPDGGGEGTMVCFYKYFSQVFLTIFYKGVYQILQWNKYSKMVKIFYVKHFTVKQTKF